MRLLPWSIAVVALFAFSNKSFVFCGLYAVFVFAGQHFMRERQKLNLRRPLVLWSLSLAIFRSDICVQTDKKHVGSEPLFVKYGCSINWYHLFPPAMAPSPQTSGFITITKAFVTVTCYLCSILGALRTGFYMMNVINTKGFRGSVCDNSFYSAPVSKFWAYAFVLSKAPELGESSSAANDR